jgi:hypothetical protein
MAEKTSQPCSECTYWTLFAPVGPGIKTARGHCRRYPPVLATGYNPATDPAYWVWPVCAASATCGEWTVREGSSFDQGAFA